LANVISSNAAPLVLAVVDHAFSSWMGRFRWFRVVQFKERPETGDFASLIQDL
jgi:hypothetical protein